MLVLVPLMAGVWPEVQVAIIHGREILVRAVDDTVGNAERLSGALQTQSEANQKVISQTGKDSATESDSARMSDEKRIAEILKANSKLADDARMLSGKLHNLASSPPPAMPSAWAFAFFAALAVALGQILYQTSAPEIVRRYTLEEYQEAMSNPGGRAPTSDEISRFGLMIRNAEFNPGTFLNRKILPCIFAVFECIRVFESQLRKRYGWDPHDRSPNRRILTKDDMKAAAENGEVQTAIHKTRSLLEGGGLFYARECLELMQDERFFLKSLDLVRSPIPRAELAEHSAQSTDLSPGNFETAAYLTLHHLRPPFKVADDAEKIAYNRERVWIGARVEYIDQSRLRPVRCFASMMFYGVASLIIAWITYTQAKSVAAAAHWLPWQ
jgi:hypothetical protein